LDGGLFVNRRGEVLGKHKGYPFYTIGQRKGLEIALGEPMFVTEIIAESNMVVLGKKEELDEQTMLVSSYNLIKYANLKESKSLLTKIRYKDKGTLAEIKEEGDLLKVLFHQPVTGIAPGQSAVFYEGDDLVGGGFIKKARI
jgi:tRNA-specific 2-thiouridylase